MFGLKSGASVYVSVVLGWQRGSVAASLRGRNIVKATWKLDVFHYRPEKFKKFKVEVL